MLVGSVIPLILPVKFVAQPDNPAIASVLVVISMTRPLHSLMIYVPENPRIIGGVWSILKIFPLTVVDVSSSDATRVILYHVPSGIDATFRL